MVWLCLRGRGVDVGVVKTHQLTYSPTKSLYGLGDKTQCTQQFVIAGKLAKEYLDHFQSRIEELDIYVEGDKLIWNGFTEGVVTSDKRMSLR
jgi:Rad9